MNSPLLLWVRSLFCRHEDVMTFSPGRFCLMCLKCGRETKGVCVRAY